MEQRLAAFFGFEGRRHQPAPRGAAGVTTFVTMAYIVAVNPAILKAAGIPEGPSMVATVMTAMVGTLVMGALGEPAVCDHAWRERLRRVHGGARVGLPLAGGAGRGVHRGPAVHAADGRARRQWIVEAVRRGCASASRPGSGCSSPSSCSTRRASPRPRHSRSVSPLFRLDG